MLVAGAEGDGGAVIVDDGLASGGGPQVVGMRSLVELVEASDPLRGERPLVPTIVDGRRGRGASSVRGHDHVGGARGALVVGQQLDRGHRP